MVTHDLISPHSPVIRRSLTRVAYLDRGLADDLAALLWREPSALIDQGELLRVNGARRTARVGWQGSTYVLKHYVEPTYRHAVKQTVQVSRAWATWEFMRRLANAGVAVPRPVACVENRWGLLRRDSYLLYPYIEGCTLRSHFLSGAAKSPEIRARLWLRIDELWQRLVELRVGLGDTNFRNFILTPDDRIWLIDLDKSRFHRSARSAARQQKRAWRQLLRSAAKCGALDHAHDRRAA